MSLPPPPSYTTGPFPSVSSPGAGPVRPGVVRVARVAGAVALAGAVLSVAGFAAFVIADSRAHSYHYATGWAAAVAGLALVTLVAPAGSVAGSAGGRAVAWTFLPVSVIGIVTTLIGNIVGTFAEEDTPTGIRVVTGFGIAGSVACGVGILVAAIAWAAPPARDFLADRRRPGRAARGRVVLGVVAGLSALAFVLAAAAVAVLVRGSRNIDPTALRDGYGRADIPGIFLGAITLTSVTAVFVAVFLAGTLVARSTRGQLVRALTYVVGFMVLGGSLPVTVYLAALKPLLDENGSGVVATDSVVAAAVVYAGAVLTHFFALLLLAMPSVSAWVASTRS